MEPDYPMNPEPDVQEIYKSDNVYFNDGDIVILVDGTAFRVHFERLSRFPHVLTSMTTNGPSPEDGEHFDGVPAFHFQSDKDLFSIFLEAVYGVGRFMGACGTGDVHAMADLLRFSTTFQCPDFRDDVINAFSLEYPSILLQWDMYTGHRQHPACIVALVHETKAVILLPAALYRFCCLEDQELEGPLIPTIHTRYTSLRRLVRKDLIQIWPRFILQEQNALRCENPVCRTAWCEIQDAENARISEMETHGGAPDALGELARYATAVAKHSSLCLQEKQSTWYRTVIRRQAVWNALPEIFRMPSWDVIKAAFPNRLFA